MKGKQIFQGLAAIAVVVAFGFAVNAYVIQPAFRMMRASEEVAKVLAQATSEKVIRKSTETVTLYNHPEEVLKDSVFIVGIMDISFTKVNVRFKLKNVERFDRFAVIHATSIEKDLPISMSFPVQQERWGDEASAKYDSTAKNLGMEWCAKIVMQKAVATL